VELRQYLDVPRRRRIESMFGIARAAGPSNLVAEFRATDARRC
jgi:hypothetical protein